MTNKNSKPLFTNLNMNPAREENETYEDTLKNIKIKNRKISSKVITNIKEYLKK